MGKRKRAEKERAATQTLPGDDLIDLLADAQAAVERALVTVAADPDLALDAAGAGPGGPGGAATRRNGTWFPVVDPVLLDRYQGLLLSSGMVGESVHHLPSRLRERTEGVLRELVAGVARDRTVTMERMDALTDELLGVIGQRIAQRVEEWRDPAD